MSYHVDFWASHFIVWGFRFLYLNHQLLFGDLASAFEGFLSIVSGFRSLFSYPRCLFSCLRCLSRAVYFHPQVMPHEHLIVIVLLLMPSSTVHDSLPFDSRLVWCPELDSIDSVSADQQVTFVHRGLVGARHSFFVLHQLIFSIHLQQLITSQPFFRRPVLIQWHLVAAIWDDQAPLLASLGSNEQILVKLMFKVLWPSIIYQQEISDFLRALRFSIWVDWSLLVGF